jgi:hypothetical protein
MVKFYFFVSLLVVCFCINNLKASCRTANCTGDWCVAGTWTPAGVPQCGDTIVIPAGFQVTVTTMENFFACGQVMVIDVFGELHFQAGKKIILPCNSKVDVKSGGKVTADNGGGNANYIEICSQIVWSAGDGTLTGPVVLAASSPLPVELLSFSAISAKRKVIAIWATATEQNSSSFTIERSADGYDFDAVGSVSAAGFSMHETSYSFTDESPFNGKSYYRLKLTNADGSTEIYSVVLVEVNAIAVDVYPNPSDGKFTVDTEESVTHFSVTDCNGKNVFSFTSNSSHDAIETHLEPGLYLIQSSDNKYRKKIIIR